jgi:hypothetical protein
LRLSNKKFLIDGELKLHLAKSASALLVRRCRCSQPLTPAPHAENLWEPQGAGGVSLSAENAFRMQTHHRQTDHRKTMKTIIAVACVALCMMATAGPAAAKGCIKGAIVGGAAGHYAGHHGLIGAAAGCLIGRHEAKKQELEQQKEDHNSATYH